MSHATPYYESALDGPAADAENIGPAHDPIRDDERARKPGRLGDFVIFLTSADRIRMGSYSERQR